MKKRDNFPGQKMIVLPEKVISYYNSNQITRDAYITDIGYFPEARDHFRMRMKGSIQNILIYCIEGSGWISVDGVRSNLHKDQVFIIPKNTPHTYAASDKNPWTIYWLHFGGEKAEQIIFNDRKTPFLKSANHNLADERIRLFDSIYYSLESEYSATNLVYSAIVLMHFLGSFSFEQQFGWQKEINERDVTGKAINFMRTNINRKLNLQEIAEQCNISVSHFCLVFKKSTSHTPVEYFNNLRIQRACELLDFTSMSVKSIADNLGFSDAFYFSRVFKKVIGQSPGSYRRHKSG